MAEARRIIALLGEAHAAKAEKRKAQPAGSLDAPLPEMTRDAFARGFAHLAETFDENHGGFGRAPKFPRPGNLAFLFRHAAREGVASPAGRHAIRLATDTLAAMARGGIHDHVGGGLHRYSVDERWFVPHFEKMLYDQAQIALNALEAWQATHDERHAGLARDLCDYVLRDLAHPAGGFYSAEDADSPLAPGRPEHAEGAFYVWSAGELRGLLGGDYELLAAHFGVTEAGNVPAGLDPRGEFAGRNILAQTQPPAETARRHGLTLTEADARLRRGLEFLHAARARRPRPHLDDKIITAWNGLMLSALARAAVVPAAALRDRQPAYRVAAERTADFLQRELRDGTRGVLHRSWRGRPGRADGFAEDYAFLIQGLLDLYEATFDTRWLQWAEELQAKMDELFYDAGEGGYFNSAAGATDVVLRLKEDHDGAEPAPGSVAASNLLRLAGLLGRPELGDRARATLASFAALWSAAPHALPQLLCALDRAVAPSRQVVLAGDAQAGDFQALLAVAYERLGPPQVLLGVTSGVAQPWLAARAPWLAEIKPRAGRSAAYVCEGFTCRAPAFSEEELRTLLT